MKVPMSRITIYGEKKDRKAVLEYLQRCGIMEISEPDTSEFQERFTAMDTAGAQSEFIREKSAGERALEILGKYSPEPSGLTDSLKGRQVLSKKEYYDYVNDIPEMMNISRTIAELSDGIAERNGNIIRYCQLAEELKPWLGLDIPLDFGGTENTACLMGTLNEESTYDEFCKSYYSEDAPPVYAEVVSTIPQQTCIMVICAKKDETDCEKRLREIGFSKPKTVHSGIPREKAEEYKAHIKKLEREIEDLENEIKSYSGARNALKFMVDYYAMRTEKYMILEKLSQSRHVFIITGYVPKCDAEELKAELENVYATAVDTEDAEDDAPVMLKNPYLTEPVEGIVETFSMPARGEIDPTSIMAFFYYAFFGLMLSDAAYGLIMVIGCGTALLKYKNMESGMKKTLRMFMYCGISTMFWGIMFGSYFGDIVSIVSGTFLGREVTIKPLWFEPVKEPMKMLMFSFLLGLIHLFTGLGIKLYQCIKQKDYMGAFVDCICWFLLVGGAVAYLFSVDLFLSMAGMTAKLPKSWANIAAGAAVIGALGILLLSSRTGSVGKRLAKGAYALYGATSWLSDILSYSRLLALGLATGVIATVFNKMGSMFGGGVLGAVLFTIVFTVGHLLNIGINLLGAYVHTNRLQFVEFFGKFYEGGGKKFKPFSGTTKYYKFKESIKEIKKL